MYFSKDQEIHDLFQELVKIEFIKKYNVYERFYESRS